jgi:hypothetical protein
MQELLRIGVAIQNIEEAFTLLGDVDGPVPGGVTMDPDNVNAGFTLSNGNLTGSTSNWNNGRSTFGRSSGRWCFEVTTTEAYSASTQAMIGIATAAKDNTSYMGNPADGNSYSLSNDQNSASYPGGAINSVFNGWGIAVGDTMMMECDFDRGEIYCKYNGVRKRIFSGLITAEWFAGMSLDGTDATINYGALAFSEDIYPGYSSWDGNQVGPDVPVTQGWQVPIASGYTTGGAAAVGTIHNCTFAKQATGVYVITLAENLTALTNYGIQVTQGPGVIASAFLTAATALNTIQVNTAVSYGVNAGNAVDTAFHWAIYDRGLN